MSFVQKQSLRWAHKVLEPDL